MDHLLQIGNWQSAIGNVLEDLTRFERVTSTFAESRSDSTELQVHHKAQNAKYKVQCICDKKQMKAERNEPRTHFEAHFS